MFGTLLLVTILPAETLLGVRAGTLTGSSMTVPRTLPSIVFVVVFVVTRHSYGFLPCELKKRPKCDHM